MKALRGVSAVQWGGHRVYMSESWGGFHDRILMFQRYNISPDHEY